MNTGTVVIGLVLIVIGIFTIWLFCLGGLLILLGFIIMIIGLIQSSPRTVVNVYGMPPQAQIGTYQQPGWQYGSAPTGQAMYCAYCGRPVAPGAVYCPGCGRSTQK